jgi:hypothetical protein
MNKFLLFAIVMIGVPLSAEHGVTVKTLKNELEVRAHLDTDIICYTLGNGQCRCIMPIKDKREVYGTIVEPDGFTLDETNPFCKKMSELYKKCKRFSACRLTFAQKIDDEKTINSTYGGCLSEDKRTIVRPVEIGFSEDAREIINLLKDLISRVRHTSCSSWIKEKPKCS